METAPYAARPEESRGRRHPEAEHVYRGPWQRDRDRIVHATAFRLMEYKTQVFLNRDGDRYRSRLTHTLEVSQIARTLARALALNEDLTEAAALAHDIGHTPFGHAGEAELNELLAEHGGFEHNAHGLRVVDLLERRYAEFPGLNLSHEVRESFVHHLKTPPETGEFAGIGAPPLEVQATILADDIAYDNHDIDDGLYSGILADEQLVELPLWRRALEGVAEGRWRRWPPALRRAEGVRRLINLLVNDAVACSRRRLDALRLDSMDAVREAGGGALALSEEIEAEKRELEAFLFRRLYRDDRVVRLMKKARRFLRELYQAYAADPGIRPPALRDRAETDGAPRAIADYLAGLTDLQAENEYRRMFL